MEFTFNIPSEKLQEFINRLAYKFSYDAETCGDKTVFVKAKLKQHINGLQMEGYALEKADQAQGDLITEGNIVT